MRAAVITSFGAPLSVQTVDRPKLIPGSVVIRVLAANVLSFAHTVLSGQSPHHTLPPLPTIPGPIGVGVVEEVAEDVFDLSQGQMVAVGNTIHSDFVFSQDDTVLIGWTRGSRARLQEKYKEGSFAELFLVPASVVVPIPQALTSQYSSSQLGILGYIGISYGAILRGDFKPGQVLIVNGATGNIGVGVVLLALAMGASRVVAVGRKLETLKSLHALDPKRVFTLATSGNIEEDAKKISELAAEADYPRNQGANLVIDAVGNAESADVTIACFKALKERGILVLVGSVIPPLLFDYATVMRKQVEIRGSFMSSQESFGDLIRLIASGLLDLNKIKVHTFSLEKVNDAIAAARGLRGFDWVVLEPQK